MEDENYMFIKQKMEELRRLVDADFGILDKLIENRGLSIEDESSVRHATDPFKRSELLLNFVFCKRIYEQFIQGLKNTAQSHVANFILAKGEYKSEYGDNWPLSERQIGTLDYNRTYLIAKFEARELVHHLFVASVLNDRQRSAISAKPVCHDQAIDLLHIIRRGSKRSYEMTIHCLMNCKQGHVAELLKEGGVVNAIHTQLQKDIGNVEELEESIVTKLTELILGVIANRSCEEVDNILRQANLRVIAAMKGQSVILFIYSKTLEELEQLESNLKLKSIQDTVEELFSHLLSLDVKSKVTINWSEEEINSNKKYFQETLIRQDSKHEYFLTESKDTKTGIPTVEPDWKESSEVRVQGTFLKTPTLKAEAYQQYRGFLEERIDPDSGLLHELHFNKALSFKETYDIKDQHPFYKRNSLLLEYIIEKKKYDSLINALIVTGQAHIANFLLGNGEYCEVFGDDWPLRESEIYVIDVNYEHLIRLLAPGEELIVRLYSKNIINRRQRDAISAKVTSDEKVEALLEILKQRSLKDFKATIRCLHETHQSHVAEILEEGGVVVKVHAEGLGDKTEDEIIGELQKSLTSKTSEESIYVSLNVPPLI